MKITKKITIIWIEILKLQCSVHMFFPLVLKWKYIQPSLVSLFLSSWWCSYVDYYLIINWDLIVTSWVYLICLLLYRLHGVCGLQSSRDNLTSACNVDRKYLLNDTPFWWHFHFFLKSGCNFWKEGKSITIKLSHCHNTYKRWVMWFWYFIKSNTATTIIFQMTACSMIVQ